MSALPRVLVVDDSAFMRRVMSQIIDGVRRVPVVGTARNGFDALKQVHALDPDIVTLDVEMPELDGLAHARLHHERDAAPRGDAERRDDARRHEATLRALELGAVDFVRKPSGSISLDLGDRRRAPARRAARGGGGQSRRAAHASAGEGRARAGPGRANARATNAVVIAASTGGPRALAEIVPALPRSSARGRADRAAHAGRLHEEPRAAARRDESTRNRRGGARRAGRSRPRVSSRPAGAT